MRKKLTNLYLMPEMIDRLKAESKRTGAPRAEIMRRAIEAYLGSQGTTNERSHQGAKGAHALAQAVE